MSKLESLPGRALELAGSIGEGIRQAVPDSAIKWVETGAALTALKSGTKVATRFVKRNPAVAVAAVAAGGLLWYVAPREAARRPGRNRRHVEAGRGQARIAAGDVAVAADARRRIKHLVGL